MSSLRDDEVTINIALFKRYYFYQLFDPRSPKIFDRHVYRSVGVAFIVTVLGVNVFSALSFLTNAVDTVDNVDLLLIMFIYCVNAISFLKITVLLYKADTVWRLFDMTRLDFLKSDQCRTNVAVLLGYRGTSTKVSDFLKNYVTALFVVWMISPLVINATSAAMDPNEFCYNIFNLRYPVTPTVYNRYFYAFYTMEVVMGIFLLYSAVVVDAFLITMCFSTTAEYEVLNLAFGSIGHQDHDKSITSPENENKKNSLKAYDDFKSNLYDQSHLYIKLKSFYSVVWIIALGLISINSIALIILSYSSILIFDSAASFSIFKLFRLPTAYFACAAQIFVYCYLFDILDTKKQSVNFGIYSCDWTKMDLKFKKLLLLTMRMNNANQINIKASRTKIVNLQLFAGVMRTTYNIVSVMLNKTAKSAKGDGLE